MTTGSLFEEYHQETEGSLVRDTFVDQGKFGQGHFRGSRSEEPSYTSLPAILEPKCVRKWKLSNTDKVHVTVARQCLVLSICLTVSLYLKRNSHNCTLINQLKSMGMYFPAQEGQSLQLTGRMSMFVPN